MVLPRISSMKRQLTISADVIDEAKLSRSSPLAENTGAVVRFLGVVRGTEDAQPIRAIDYQAFQRMAEHQFGLLFGELEKRWPIHSIHVVHRIGLVNAGEPSLWVEVTAAHRAEAFAAAQFLIDEMKRVVPIWKKPVPPSGVASPSTEKPG